MKHIITFIFCIYSILVFGQFHIQQTEFQPISFQSTSAMKQSGSSLTSNPVLNNDGTAMYNGATYTSNKVGQRRNTPGTPGGNQPPENQQPIGDTPWPLMLLIIGFYITIKKEKELRNKFL